MQKTADTDFQKAVKYYHEKSGLGYVKFAAVVGVHYVTMWRWINGIAKPSMAARGYWIKKMKGTRNDKRT